MDGHRVAQNETARLSEHQLDELCVNTIRCLSMDAVQKADSGHPGLPMGAAPMAYVLWDRFLRHDPHKPRWPNRDRFILSAGHGCMLLYSLLHLTGYDLTLDDIKQFRQWGSKTPGHPEHLLVEGIETTTGPLGQGFGNGVGMAIAERYLAAHFNRPGHEIVNHRVYALISDGDLMEGVASEAASLAGHLGLSNLIYIYDNNHISIEGSTDLAFTEDRGKRFEAYGWFVQDLPDGNDLDAVDRAIRAAQAEKERPSLIICRTHIAYGSPNKQDTAGAHGAPLGEEEVKLTKHNLGWPAEPPFYVPVEALAHFRKAVERGEKGEAEWQKRLEEYRRAFPDLAAEWDRYVRGELPEGWGKKLPVFKPSEGMLATRQASGKVLNAIAPSLPTLLGGSADLAPSTDTLIKGAGDFEKGNYSGRNLHFGVREHGMGAIVNGMALGGLLPYGATFLIFSDYMRPSVRLAALMEAHSIFVFTHDSVFLGEDGPTHEPIEHLPALRSIPNLCLIRPADANETAVAWRVAIERRGGPVALALTRQKLPILDREKYASAEGLRRGAYVLADPGGKQPQILLIASGSEVGVGLEAYEKLAAEGIAARVVSMPSWDLFEAQPGSYRDQVLPPEITARLAIEAASPFGWERYVSPKGAVIGMRRFGASAPYKVLAEKFGFTAANVVRRALELLGRRVPEADQARGIVGGNPLLELKRFGQSVWYDYIRRGEITSGHLKTLIDEDGLSGVTSNPSIFEKAIAGSKDYDEAIRRLVDEGLEVQKIFERLAVEDIQRAADLFRPIYDSTGGQDGFVSLEVSPTLAHDTAGTIAEARRLFAEVNRPNALVKIPGTREGLAAIEQMLAEGVNINITLLFDVERYLEVAHAYLAALETRVQQGKPINRIASVASFFVSRIDTLADHELGAKLQKASSPAEREKLEVLMGRVAIANAKRAYREFKKIFSSSRFKALADKGARVQRVLWASTSTKNPKFPDTLYVDNLIGPDTINTMPAATLTAFRGHGKARLTIEEGLEEAERALSQLEEAGISLKQITRQLEEDGVAAFSRDFEKLESCIAEKRQKILAGSLDPWSFSAGKLGGAIQSTLARLDERKFTKALWDRDPTLWKDDPRHQKIISNALGWLTVSHAMLEHLTGVLKFVEEVRQAGFQQGVLLGMGGSSLCPDVCRATFEPLPGYLSLRVLDSTVPAAIRRVEKSLDLAHTLFLVSSKSGGTTETLSLFKYFYERVSAAKKERAGEHFVAITDPGTSLERLAREKNFRAVLHGYPDIGGRYSALSNFGMVPAALMGIDVRGMLERAERMEQACAGCVPASDNPGVALGVILAEAARAGRDKVTFVVSRGIETFAGWLEQLIAESTGKEGKGLIPVTDEFLGKPEAYPDDRLFVHIKLADTQDAVIKEKLKALEEAGHPVVRINVTSKLDLGEEFFRWEVATATAGALLGIDAFDQPNVQESKDNTHRLLEEFSRQGKLPEPPHDLEVEGLRFYCDPATRQGLAAAKGQARQMSKLEAFLRAFFDQAGARSYIALMAYIEPSSGHEALLRTVRIRLRDSLHLATTVGFGPRFLHSTGQLHKGGPAKGLFIQITADDAQDLAIPGEPYSFSLLKSAQAVGDMQALLARNRPLLHFHFGRQIQTGLDGLLKVVELALDKSPKAGA